MAVQPPTDPWYRRSWSFANRPFNGCGCLATLLIFILLSSVISLIFPNVRICVLPFVF